MLAELCAVAHNAHRSVRNWALLPPLSACQRLSVGARWFHIGHHQSDKKPQCFLSAIHQLLLALSLQGMSQISANTSSSSSNFLSVFNATLDTYEKKTKTKLLTHPLAAQLQSCDSPTAILSVLQDVIQQFDSHCRDDERLKNWLNPTINVLYTFSSTVGQGVGLVSL
jgi:hypothetical protein